MNLSSLVAFWAERYDVETALECILGDAPTACDALATRGIRVTTFRHGQPLGLADAHVDLVVVHGIAAPPHEWRAWISSLATKATKLVVVGAPDPDLARGATVARLVGRALGRGPVRGSWGATCARAPVLWDIGRVREHERTGGGSHAFVIDVTPRTPQARRKLRLAGTTG